MVWWKVNGMLGNLQWQMCREEGVDAAQNACHACRCSFPLQGYCAVVEHVVQHLLLAAVLALWGRHLLPQEEVPVVWRCVCDRVEGKLERTLW